MTPQQFIASHPMTIPAASLTIGSWLGAIGVPIPYWYALTIAFGVIVATAAIAAHRSKRTSLMGAIVLPGIVIVGIGVGFGNSKTHRAPYIDNEGPVSLNGHITKVIRCDKSHTTIEVETDTLWTETTAYVGLKGVLLVQQNLPNARPGMQITVRGDMREPHNNIFSDFDYATHLRQNGESFYATCDSLTSISAESKGHWRYRYMGFCQQTIDESLTMAGVSDANRGFLRALLIGDKSVIPADMRRTYVNCGTAHILAVSGMHVGIIYGLLSVVLRVLFRIPKQRRALIASIFLWGYAIMVGMPSSVLRAVLMFTIVAIGGVIGRRPSLLQELSVALFVIVLIDPMGVTSPGLWLSFAAVGGILSINGRLDEYTYRMEGRFALLCQSIGVCLAAQIATLPITLYSFHTFPTYFLVNNLIILPFIAPIVMISLACVVTSWIPGVSWLLGKITNTLINIVSSYATAASSLPYATIDNIPFGTADFIVTAVMTISVFMLIRNQTKITVHLAYVSVIALLATLAGELLTQSSQNRIEIVSRSGKLNVVITEGLGATLLMADTTHTLSIDAARHTIRDQRAHIAKISKLEPVTQIITSNDTIAIVRSALMPLPEASIYVIDCDRAPLSTDRKGAQYYVTSNCNFAQAWIWRHRNSIRIERNDIRKIVEK